MQDPGKSVPDNLSSGDRKRIELELLQNKIRAEGYPIFEIVISFLLEYRGKKFSFRNRRNNLKNDDIIIDFDYATNLENAERINEDYVPRIGKELCVIGAAYRDHFVLMMAADGSVYGGYSDYLCKIGNSGIDAIEAIMDDREFEEVK